MGKSDQCALQKLKIRIQLSSPRISEHKARGAARDNHKCTRSRTVPGNITYVDYEKLYGTSPETILGKHVQELMGASDYQKVQGYVEAVLSGEKVTYVLGPSRWQGALSCR